MTKQVIAKIRLTTDMVAPYSETSPPEPAQIEYVYLCRGCEGQYDYVFDNGLCCICNDNMVKGLPKCYHEPKPFYHVPCADEKRHLDMHFFHYVMSALVEHKERTHGLNTELLEHLKKALDEL